MKKQLLLGSLISIAAISLIPGMAFAHVVVTPSQTAVGQGLIFSISVPNEEQVAVTNVKLEIPEGVTDVMPTTKEGWMITTTKSGSEVTEVVWSEGAINSGERQDFSFSARVPAKVTDINWKAYQTYADGTVVHWDQKPTGSDDADGNAGPYSVTHVVNDLSDSTTTPAKDQAPISLLTIAVSIVAIILSISSLLIRRRR